MLERVPSVGYAAKNIVKNMIGAQRERLKRKKNTDKHM